MVRLTLSDYFPSVIDVFVAYAKSYSNHFSPENIVRDPPAGHHYDSAEVGLKVEMMASKMYFDLPICQKARLIHLCGMYCRHQKEFGNSYDLEGAETPYHSKAEKHLEIGCVVGSPHSMYRQSPSFYALLQQIHDHLDKFLLNIQHQYSLSERFHLQDTLPYVGCHALLHPNSFLSLFPQYFLLDQNLQNDNSNVMMTVVEELFPLAWHPHKPILRQY
mmetsp:Transcript_11224/g.15100  ORF Transcript_11224/g.15100 Transcript_11224/m.15100 type:complete len:218 (-) Transcript_11224:1113-1766(-)